MPSFSSSMKERFKPDLNFNSNEETCLWIFLVPGSVDLCQHTHTHTHKTQNPSLPNDCGKIGNSLCKLVRHTHTTGKLPNVGVHTRSLLFCPRHCLGWTQTLVALRLPLRSSHSIPAVGVNSCGVGGGGNDLTTAGLETICQKFSCLCLLRDFFSRKGTADSTRVLFSYLNHVYN